MQNSLPGIIDTIWLPIKDGDTRAAELYLRHYSATQYKDNRRKCQYYANRFLFVGPGEKTVLITPNSDALFVWRKFIDASGQQGVNCAVFRNESPMLSSALILDAERIAWRRWPGERLYTYVNADKVKSKNPGFCYLKAGWTKCGYTKGGLLILEKYPASAKP